MINIENLSTMNIASTQRGLETICPYISIPDAAFRLHISKDELLAFLDKHDLRAYRIPDDLLFLASAHYEKLGELIHLTKKMEAEA